MARVEVPVTVLNASGLPVSGASVSITHRSSGTAASWYTTETGGTASTGAVTTDANGRILAWVERGAYNLAISGVGITSYTEAWDATPGGDGTIDNNWVGGIAGEKITTGTVSSARLPSVAAPAIVTTLPVSPVDGTEVLYQPTGSSAIWRMKYKSGTPNYWYCVGGGMLAASAPADLAVSGLGGAYYYTLIMYDAPYSGFWEINAGLAVRGVSGSGYLQVIVTTGTTSTTSIVDRAAAGEYVQATSHAEQITSMYLSRVITVSPGATRIRLAVYAPGATMTFTAGRQFLDVRPVRLDV